jgi:cystathionine beta-lyase/cystathionine gamma-synthase
LALSSKRARAESAPTGAKSVTYVLRQERATVNASELAAWLGEQPAVVAVHYAGMPGHPDHRVAERMLASCTASGARRARCRTPRPCPSAFSPRSGSASSASTRAFFPLSVGIGAVADLKAELAKAFTAANAKPAEVR